MFVKKLDRVSSFALRKRPSNAGRRKAPKRKKKATNGPIEGSQAKVGSVGTEAKQEKCSARLIVSVELSRLVRRPKRKKVAGRTKSESVKVNGLRKVVSKASTWREVKVSKELGTL